MGINRSMNLLISEMSSCLIHHQVKKPQLARLTLQTGKVKLRDHTSYLPWWYAQRHQNPFQLNFTFSFWCIFSSTNNEPPALRLGDQDFSSLWQKPLWSRNKTCSQHTVPTMLQPITVPVGVSADVLQTSHDLLFSFLFISFQAVSDLAFHFSVKTLTYVKNMFCF